MLQLHDIEKSRDIADAALYSFFRRSRPFVQLGSVKKSLQILLRPQSRTPQKFSYQQYLLQDQKQHTVRDDHQFKLCKSDGRAWRITPRAHHMPRSSDHSRTTLYTTIYRVRMIPAKASHSPLDTTLVYGVSVPVLIRSYRRSNGGLVAGRAAPHQGSGPAAEFSVVLVISFRE
ncbi:hypothetical protein CHU98_g5583 [Xylaria longipes]|nr:hypothetical protein CHU98_g5583 [Xylaria longipes]